MQAQLIDQTVRQLDSQPVKCPTCGADVRFNGFTVETTERVSYMHLANGIARLNTSQSDGRCFCSACSSPLLKQPRELMRRESF